MESWQVSKLGQPVHPNGMTSVRARIRSLSLRMNSECNDTHCNLAFGEDCHDSFMLKPLVGFESRREMKPIRLHVRAHLRQS